MTEDRNRILVNDGAARVLLTLIISALMVTVCFFSIKDTVPKFSRIQGFSSKTDISTYASTRYANRFAEEFNNYTNIDYSNTTALINTYTGRTYLSGGGENPRSEIRDLSTPDRTRNYNRFTGRCVAQDGKFYIRNQYSSNQINIYSSLNSFMNNGNQIGSFNLPFNPSNYGQMIYVNGHLYFSNSNTVDKYRLADNTKVQCSLSGQGATSWAWGGGSQCGLTTDGTYIYTYSGNLLRIYDMQENLVRQVNLPEAQNSLSTCFSAGHYFYPVDYSVGNVVRRVDGDTGNIENYNDVVMQGFTYLTCFNYDYFGNSLIMTNGNSGNPDKTWTIDNFCYTFGGTGDHDSLGFIQSKALFMEQPTIGAAKITWYEKKPAGTDIVYNMTVDGENWVTMENNTNHIFQHRGSKLIWNASLTTTDPEVSPYIEKVVIEYDLFSDPVPHLPPTSEWQGNSTPLLQWNFTDPDAGDHQSDYLIEIFNDTLLQDQVYNSSWQNSTFGQHRITEDLDDGTYYWRVKTKDMFHVESNYSGLKRMKIDVSKPIGNITIEGDLFSVNDQLVNLAIFALDNGSGVHQMQIIDDSGETQQWEPYKTEKRVALSTFDGLKTLGIRFRDHAGILSDVFQDSIYLDYLGPGDVNISSPSHPDSEMYYSSTDPIFTWEPPFEVTGIKGYAYLVDGSPSTEPYRDISGPESAAQNTTFPGEFPGLQDGTYYFHITACDVYDQWSNTSHYQFNIDATPPIVDEMMPEEEVWLKTANVDTSVIFKDVEGYGLDLGTLEYSFRVNGSSEWTDWSGADIEMEVLDTGIAGNPVKVKAVTAIEFQEGVNNAFRWRVTDLSGNGPVITEERSVSIDASPVYFTEHFPEFHEYTNDMTVSCGITVADNASGVLGESIEYSVSDKGNGSENFKDWMPLGNRMKQNSILVSLDIDFDPGKENYIKWRAKDVVGNPLVESEAHRVWVNSAPLPVMTSPRDDQEVKGGTLLLLDGSGSSDPEGDVLSFYWLIKNRTQKTVAFQGWNITMNTTLDLPGDYVVYLYVDDGHELNESKKAYITVTGKGSSGGGSSDDDDSSLDSSSASSGSSWWWLIVIVVCLLLVILLVVLLVVRRRKKEEGADDTAPTKADVPSAEYPQSSYGQPPPSGQPSYPYPQQGYPTYNTQAQSSYYQAPGYGAQPGPPAPASQGPDYNAPAPPETSGPGVPSAGPASSVQDRPKRLLPPPPASPPPSYVLPQSTSAGPVQDLSLKALPPAPDEIPEKDMPSEETEVQLPEEDVQVTQLTLQCHNCGGQYTAQIESGPALVTCAHCGTQGQINA